MTPFDAWVLPPGVVPPPGAPAPLVSGGWSARRLIPDPGWMRSLTDRLAAAAPEIRSLSAHELVGLAGALAERLLSPDDELRLEALEHLAPSSGLSEEMAAAVLDGMARDWTAPRLEELLRRELGGAEALDGFVERDGRRVRAMGPGLCVQVVSGSVPGVGGTALLRSLLLKSPTLLKPGRGDVVLPVLVGRELARSEPRLAAALAVVYWRGGDGVVEEAALAGADAVVAYGGDDATRELRARVPITARFLAYHHRVSVGVVGREALTRARAARVASELAGAVGFFDQRGCVSPQLVFVEEGGAVSPQEFAKKLAAAMEVVEKHLPGGAMEAAEASAVHQARGAAEMRAAAGAGVEVRHREGAWWTVILDPEATLDELCVGRVVRLRPVADVAEAAALVAGHARHLQTVGIAGGDGRADAVAEAFAAVGASRVTSFAQVPFPPPWWHHDGQGALAPLVRWIDYET